MSKTRLTRRALLGSTFSLFAFLKPAGAGNGDRGIGGMGVVAQPPEDRGIGGTGVIGTIRKFGSVVVNGMRIAYPADAAVEIDGQPASPRDLRLGQVAQCVTEKSATGLTTSRILVASEVIGPIESIGRNSLVVLGQTVLISHIAAKSWQKGQWVAVSGLRKLNGAVVASHVQNRDDSIARVSGPVTLAADGAAKIGGLKLVNLDAALAGRRVLADVGRIDGAPAALKTVVDPEFAAMPDVRRFSIEAYVARTGAKASFGSGLTAATPSDGRGGAALSTSQARAIVAITVNPDGSLTASGQKSAQNPNSSAPEPQRNSDPAHDGKTAPADSKNDSQKSPDKSKSVPQRANPDPAPVHEAPTPQPEPEPKSHGRRR